MVDAAALVPSIIGFATGGVGLGAGAVLAMKFLDWLGGRVDKREAAVAAGAERLDLATGKLIMNMSTRMDKMAARIDEVEAELRDCQKKHAESDAKVMRLEALMQGYGDARMHAQLIVSADKLSGGNDDGRST